MLKTKPLVLMLPWLGATPKAVSKYVVLYKDMGCDVMVNHSNISDFLWPRKGLKHSHKFLTNVVKQLAIQNQPVIIHSMSIGCYFYSLMLLHFENEPEKFGVISRSIKAQILDSPVVGTLSQMAIGVSKMTTSTAVTNYLSYIMIIAYFAISKPYTVKYYDQCIEVIKDRPPIVPSLMITSKLDPMALEETFKEFVDSWRKRGLDVDEKILEDSKHIKHFRNYPKQYKQLVENLLQQSVKFDLRSKL